MLAATEIGFPVVLKLCGPSIAHKTERGLVRLGLTSEDDVATAAAELLGAATAADGPVELLVAPMLSGRRELIAGLHRDPQFGMTVMLGVGGVLAEAIADVTFRLAPIERVDADEMIDELRAQALLGPMRGEPAVDRERLADVLLGLSRVAVDDPDGRVDRPQPADRRRRGADRRGRARRGGSLSSPVDAAHFRALFDPRGVIVAGASAHPGKFGFVALHNILRCGYAGNVFATNLEGGSVLGIDTVRSVEEVPAGAADLVFVCTPAAANVALLKACAARGSARGVRHLGGVRRSGSGRRGRAA